MEVGPGYVEDKTTVVPWLYSSSRSKKFTQGRSVTKLMATVFETTKTFYFASFLTVEVPLMHTDT